MKKFKKEFIIFIGAILLILICLIISNYKSNKPKYDKDKISISFDNSEISEEYYEDSNEDDTETSSDDNAQDEDLNETEVIETEETEVVEPSTEETTEVVEPSTEETTEVSTEETTEVEQQPDTSIVTKDNIFKVITSLFSNQMDLSYVTEDFSFDESIKTELEIFNVSEVENHFDEGYVLGYIETPVDDLVYRFDFTLSENNKLASLTYTKQ